MQNRLDALRNRISSLIEPGVLGHFDHIELTEIICTPPRKQRKQSINILAIAVLSEGRPDVGGDARPELLTERIAVDGYKGWSFGVARTLRPVEVLDDALRKLGETEEWALSGMPLSTGRLEPQPGIFAPPDATAKVPLNRILKNNFWAGSHVFRFTRSDKGFFDPFLDEPRRLQALSDAVASAAPMAFAGLPDFLGDVLIQIPVKILTPAHGDSSAEIGVTWRRDASPRDLIAATRVHWDGALQGAAITPRFSRSTPSPLENRDTDVETEIWDAETGVVVCASTKTSILKRIELATHIAEPEPRRFLAPQRDRERRPEQVPLYRFETHTVGEADDSSANYWLGRRQDQQEKRRLDETKGFVQYRSGVASGVERERALSDIRWLISEHGRGGVDLWDPYLAADDLLNTLFWCPYADAPLRALSGGRETPVSSPLDWSPFLQPTTARPSFAEQQRTILDRDVLNREGLRLEYRTRAGSKGWEFHDRFLIFPAARSDISAWSLGTSVNSVGRHHHILQQVSNPVQVAGAFADLWSQLTDPEHLVWKSW